MDINELKKSMSKDQKGQVITESDYVLRDKSKEKDKANTVIMEDTSKYAKEIEEARRVLAPDYREELKKELTGQLIEYAICRQIAKKFSEIYDYDSFYREESPVEYDLTYNRIHPSEDIARAYVSAVGRGKRKLPPPESAFSVIVARKFVSVSSRIIHVMRKLWKGRRIEYQELFDACEEKSELVATFLATLELVKGKRVRVDGDGDHAIVYMIDNKENKNV